MPSSNTSGMKIRKRNSVVIVSNNLTERNQLTKDKYQAPEAAKQDIVA